MKLDWLIVLFLFSTTLFSNAQCPVPDPTGVDACNPSTGTALLSATGSTGYYSWYTNATGGNPISTGNSFETPVLSTTTTYYVSATDTNTSLEFDGSNDYIALDMSYTGTGAIDSITIEAWVNTVESGTGDNFSNWSILDFDRSEFFNIYISGDNGQVGFSTASTSGGVDDFFSGSGNTVNDGTWHHIACVYDGTDKIIYIDGIEVARRTNPHSGNGLGSSTTRFGFIGDGSEAPGFDSTRNNKYYNGFIDELRIWEDVRTATELFDNRDTCLTGSEANLIAYYNFDETTGTTLNDVTGNGNVGTLRNFGSNPWSSGATLRCECESGRVAVTATFGDAMLVDQHLDCGVAGSIDAGAGYTSYLWSTGETTQVITPSTPGVYAVTTTTGPCPYTDSVTVTGDDHAQNALVFAGTNDFLSIDGFTYEGTNYTELTVESWIKTSESGDQVIASYDRSEYWRVEINGTAAEAGQVGFGVRTNSGTVDFSSIGRVDDGEWHHVACVFDNGTMSIYIDGVLDNDSVTSGTAFGSGVRRYGFVGTGSEASTFDGSRGPNSYYDGELEELRIWNTARSVTEIRENMTQHVGGNDTGLEVYFKFDEGTGSSVTDYATANKANAILKNFPASPWVTSGAPVGDESAFIYPGSWAGQTVTVNSCDGESFTVSNMSGTPAGVHVYYVNTVPNTTSGVAGVGLNNRYFGVFKVNDPAATYTATYNYTGNPGVWSANEGTLALYTRPDNAATSWTNSGAVLSSGPNTLVTTASSTEFILGSTGDPLPIELVNFTATPNNGVVELNWTTSAEIDNDFFTIERSQDGERWEIVSYVDAQEGPSSMIRNYVDLDEKPHQGLSYYRLKQTDVDGKYEYSHVVAVQLSTDNEFAIYPNPTVAQLMIQADDLDVESLSIYDGRGSDVTHTLRFTLIGENQVQLDVSGLKSGVYFVRSSQRSGTFIKQ